MKTYTDRYGHQTTPTTIYIPPEQREALIKLAGQQRRTMSAVATIILGDYLKERGLLEEREVVNA